MRGTDFPIFGEKIFGRCDGRIFHCKRKRFCHIRKLLKKVLKKSENRPDSYLDLRKARFGFTTSQGRGGSIEGHRADTDSNQFNKQITGGR